MDLVVDASVVVLALGGKSATDRELRRRLAHAVCHAPHLVDAEVGSSLRRGVRAGALTAAAGRTGLGSLRALIDERYPHGPLAGAAWQLRDKVSFYDALYVALAAGLDLPLLTADARLAATPGLPCEVELVIPRSVPGAGSPS